MGAGQSRSWAVTARPAYRVEFKPSARKELEALPRRDAVRVATRIASLAQDPRPMGVEKLAGAATAYRVRVGDYRILYEIVDEVLVVTVIRIGHRREVSRR